MNNPQACQLIRYVNFAALVWDELACSHKQTLSQFKHANYCGQGRSQSIEGRLLREWRDRLYLTFASTYREVPNPDNFSER